MRVTFCAAAKAATAALLPVGFGAPCPVSRATMVVPLGVASGAVPWRSVRLSIRSVNEPLSVPPALMSPGTVPITVLWLSLLTDVPWSRLTQCKMCEVVMVSVCR